ncbi:MAG: hypothetical protein ACHQZS_01600 [Candidatus Binatales bacterium]
MVIARLKLKGLIVPAAVLGAMAAAAVMPGCAALSAGRADCNVVRNQRGAGRSDSDIASALGVSDSDVAACGAAGGGEGSGGAEGGGGDQSSGKPPL